MEIAQRRDNADLLHLNNEPFIIKYSVLMAERNLLEKSSCQYPIKERVVLA